jgi:hypothetical protein
VLFPSNGSRDQAHGQPEAITQTLFGSRHLALIDFVVIACQVEQTVQDQNLHLVGSRMPQPLGILCGNLNRDGDVADKTMRPDFWGNDSTSSVCPCRETVG